MSQESDAKRTAFFQEIASQVQADADSRNPGATTAPTPPETPGATADPNVQASTSTSTPAATTAKGEPLIAGKFKTMEEFERAHHLLMHSLNALKNENDQLRTANTAAAVAAPPISEGRPNPALSPDRTDPEYQKWIEQYGIDPADIDARARRIFTEEREREAVPIRAMQAADAYMLGTYPEFPVKIDEVKAFVVANAPVRERVGDLWRKGQYAEAMEIGWLAYDNALRATIAATGAASTGTQAINQDRNHGGLMSSQAGGPHETAPNRNGFPQTLEDWAHIRALREAGQDAEARRLTLGPLIAHIPALNPGGQR